MGEEFKRTYTIRIPEQVAARMEEAARTHGITPTTLIQSLILRKFKTPEGTDRGPDIAPEVALAAKLETLRKSVERLEQIGEREVTRREVGQSIRAQNGFTIHPRRQVESAVLPSEIQMLPPFEGYLCIAGHHRARVRIPYLAPVRCHLGFIRRVEGSTVDDSWAEGRSDSVIRLRPTGEKATPVHPPRPRV